MTEAQRCYIEDLIVRSCRSIQAALDDAGIPNYVTGEQATRLEQVDVTGASDLIDYLLANLEDD